jgi:hypothetical protein
MNMGKPLDIGADDLDTVVGGSVINHINGVGLAGLGDHGIQTFGQIGGVVVIGDENGK